MPKIVWYERAAACWPARFLVSSRQQCDHSLIWKTTKRLALPSWAVGVDKSFVNIFVPFYFNRFLKSYSLCLETLFRIPIELSSIRVGVLYSNSFSRPFCNCSSNRFLNWSSSSLPRSSLGLSILPVSGSDILSSVFSPTLTVLPPIV
jgi:hypothetical protein